MFRNYIETTLRALFTQKLFSLINLVGLAVGLASVILIGLYVRDELSFDRYHVDAERLYRVSRDYYPVNMPEELLREALSLEQYGCLPAFGKQRNGGPVEGHENLCAELLAFIRDYAIGKVAAGLV